MKNGDYFPHIAGQGERSRQVLEDEEDIVTVCCKLCYLFIIMSYWRPILFFRYFMYIFIIIIVTLNIIIIDVLKVYFCSYLQHYFGRRKNCYSIAIRSVRKAMQYSTINRKLKKKVYKKVRSGPSFSPHYRTYGGVLRSYMIQTLCWFHNCL